MIECVDLTLISMLLLLLFCCFSFSIKGNVMVKTIVSKAVMKLDVQKQHVAKIHSNVKMVSASVWLGAVMVRLTARLVRMKKTVTEITQIPSVSPTIFNVPTVKIAFQLRGSGKL